MRMHKTKQIIPPAARGLAKIVVSALVALLVGQAVASESLAQAGAPPADLWLPVDAAAASSASRPKRLQFAALYQTLRLNQLALANLLQQAPMEFTEAARVAPPVITLPMPDGSLARFTFEEAPIMESGLAQLYPEIKTYRVKGIDDPTATVRFDSMPSGFHAMVLASSGTVLIDPQISAVASAVGSAVSASRLPDYTSYYKRDAIRSSEPFTCGVGGDSLKRDAGHLSTESAGKRVNIAAISGVTLRTYRLAVAATNEYAVAFGGNTVAGTLASQVVVMNRVNGIFEREIAVRMIIVNNNNLLLYAGDNLSCGGACTAANDPYTNNSGRTMLTENQAKVDAVIGTANYDIGHVFSTLGGGVATTPSVCNDAAKARGVSGQSDPIGDSFAVEVVAHELGHQWGANHSFNGAAGSCAPPARDQASGYEVGSGVSIMGYVVAGCQAQRLAGPAIDTFHVKSLEEMLDTRDNALGNTCGVATATNNALPVVTGPGNFTIPRLTPFALTATATDASVGPVDALTYDWQQYDLDVGPTGNGTIAVPNTDADGIARPIFRSYLPTVGGTRLFPSLTYILNNANVPPSTYLDPNGSTYLTGELLPAIARVMNFQVVVRDNRLGGGGLVTATSAITVDGASGPFVVTAPNTAVNVVGGSPLNVTWNVAGTAAAPVSAANVKISLSTNGGNTFPTVLAASAPNNGAATVTLPNTATTTARIKVEAVGNIFFDISDANFTITAGVVAAGPLDVDASNTATRYDAATDGVLIVRYMLGFTGTALTDNALGATGTRRDPAAIKTYLDGIRLASLDVDGDNKIDALTDGLLIVRYMLNIRGAALVAGAVNPAGSRTSFTAVETFLGALMP